MGIDNMGPSLGFLNSEYSGGMGMNVVEHGDRKLQAVDFALIDIQSRIRSDFNWDVSDDYESAESLSISASDLTCTKNAFNKLKERFNNCSNVVILGAAVEPKDLYPFDIDCLFVAADGSVGVFDELQKDDSESAWQRLALVVSDADGGEATIKAASMSVPFALHAHGDNKKDWPKLLTILETRCDSLLLTHQCPNDIDGMVNPGGFTDGDRAACIVAACGVPINKITLLGFQSDVVGRWTGITDPMLKLRKLKWMDEVLELLKEVEK